MENSLNFTTILKIMQSLAQLTETADSNGKDIRVRDYCEKFTSSYDQMSSISASDNLSDQLNANFSCLFELNNSSSILQYTILTTRQQLLSTQICLWDILVLILANHSDSTTSVKLKSAVAVIKSNYDQLKNSIALFEGSENLFLKVQCVQSIADDMSLNMSKIRQCGAILKEEITTVQDHIRVLNNFADQIDQIYDEFGSFKSILSSLTSSWSNSSWLNLQERCIKLLNKTNSDNIEYFLADNTNTVHASKVSYHGKE